ncbi:50S ribosomal protein L11 methyltransferase [Deferrisoma sp.]
MLTRTRWKVQEIPAEPGEAEGLWAAAREGGATGAVTSWGSRIPGRRFLRVFWEVREDAPVPSEGEDLEEENWTPYWRQTLRAVPVEQGIWLVPAWTEPPNEAEGTVLRIDPGMAFGAGDHPTTRLCLRLLRELAGAGRLPDRVLDVGTGTGVLALAAAVWGAGEVIALDIDPFGFAACRRNARLNGLEDRVRPLLLSPDLLRGRYPLVLANIVASQLRTLAPDLRRFLAPAGRLVVSGFQAEEADGVATALGLPLEERREEDGWVALVLAGREEEP